LSFFLFLPWVMGYFYMVGSEMLRNLLDGLKKHLLLSMNLVLFF